MRSAQILTVLAVLASASSMSTGHTSNPQIHRRRAVGVNRGSLLRARAARAVNLSEMVERSELAARGDRKRGINQRRCGPKSQTASSTSSSTPTTTKVTEAQYTDTPQTTTKEVKAASETPETTSETPETTSEAPKTTTKAIKTSSSAAAAATTNSSSGSSSGTTYTGEGTYYSTGLGACGITNVDTDYICAVSQLLYDGFDGYTGADPNSNPICGKKIKATYEGKSVTVTVTDRCTGCAVDDLDFSPTAFSQLADQSVGRLKGMTWVWVS